jgi:hypothetical protein
VANYSWNNGQGSGSGAPVPITGLCVGTYIVTITDNSGCSIIEQYKIKAVNDITYTSNVGQVTCQNGCNGFASVSASSSSGISYIWSNSATTSSIGNLCPGIYTVTMTNGVGCTKTKNFTIITNPQASNNWHKNTANLAGASDVVERVIRDPQGNTYVMGEFIDVTEIEGVVIQSKSLSSPPQVGIFVAAYSTCGDLKWLVHTENPYNTMTDLDGFDLDFDVATNQVVLFGKWDSDGQGMELHFYSSTGSSGILTNAPSTDDVFTMEISSGSGVIVSSNINHYNIDYSNVCTSGKSRNNLKYIGGKINNQARVGEYQGNVLNYYIIEDINSNNTIIDFELDGTDVYAAANLNNAANFGMGNSGSANDAIVLKTFISSTSPNVANSFNANCGNMKIHDIQFESQIYNELTVVGEYKGTMLGWPPTMTLAISSNINTGFIARFAQNLQTLSTYQLEDPSLINAKATAIYDDPDGMVVVGVLEGGAAGINTYYTGGGGASAGTNDVSGPGLNSMWVANFNGGGAPQIEWMSGSSSNRDMVVNDVIYDYGDQEFFVGGSYLDDINLPPTSMLAHPNPNQELGFIIRGGEFYGSGQGTYYKTDQSNNSASIANLSTTSDLVIYPNPNNGQFQIQLENDNSGIVNISVVDVTGRMVYQTRTEKETDLFTQTINLSSIPSGMYLITIENNGNAKHQKFMVK